MADRAIIAWTEALHEKFANGIAVLVDMSKFMYQDENGMGLTSVKKQIAAAIGVTTQTLHNYTVYKKDRRGTLCAPLKLSVVLSICKSCNIDFPSFAYAVLKSRNSQELMGMLSALRTGRATLQLVEVEERPDNILLLPSPALHSSSHSTRDSSDEGSGSVAAPRINFVSM